MSESNARSVVDRVTKEAREMIASPAIGRYDTEIFGRRKVLWLTNAQGGEQVRYVSGFTGGTAHVETGRPRTLSQKGSVNVYKNTKLGELLILEQSGTHSFVADVGEREITILSKLTYQPNLQNCDALLATMSAGSSPPLRVASLREWLQRLGPALNEDEAHEVQALEENDLGVEEREDASESSIDQAKIEEEELQRLIDEEQAKREREEEELLRLIEEEEKVAREIQAKEAEQQNREEEREGFEAMLDQIDEKRAKQEELRKRIVDIKARRQQFIRTQQDLRTQHILDPIQERIKRDHFFDDTYVVIEGGPGTGKTTTLIQRIKFLTSRSILEYFEDSGRSLTEEQEHVLFGDRNSWIFISPSQLLKDYLKNAMSDEGLHHLEPSVVDWETHRNNLCRKYQIYSARSFLEPMGRRDEGRGKLFFLSDLSRLRSLEREFQDQLLQKVAAKITSFRHCSFESADLKVLQKNILSNAVVPEFSRLGDVFKSYEQIKTRYREAILPFVNEGDEVLSKVVRLKLMDLESDRSAMSSVKSIIEETEDRSKSDWIERLSDAVSAMVKKAAMKMVGLDEELTERERRLAKASPSFLTIEARGNAEKIAFSTLFRTLGAGARSNVFDLVLPAFREFRSTKTYENTIRAYSKSVLVDILKTKNRKLHPEEESFLLGFVNRVVGEFRISMPQVFRDMQQSEKHSFQVGYEEAIKAVIAVDEVSDFTLLDIDCIVSLKHPLIHSVTFCGDLMQRMTTGGLRNWENLDSILSRRIAATGSYCSVIPLETSYRQSPSVLEVARALYKDQQNREAPFKSAQPSNAFEPKPKLLVCSDDAPRVKWLAEYIKSITEDYAEGVLPTIAVIVENDDAVVALKKKLEEEPAIWECGLFIDACIGGNGIGRPSSVRIFSVEFIKGLEFESVIFHDIDALDSATSRDLIGKYLYVGISRAAYHLALTSSKELPSSLNCISHLLEREVLNDLADRV